MKDDRLISLNAAIGLICTEGTRLERNGTVAMAEIKQWCVDLLEALPSAQRWIPCSQRLPYAEYGESDTVFATCGYRDVEDTSVRWTKELYFNGGVWCYPTGECYDQKVYAWMEKPKPYMGKEGDGDD